MRAESWAFRKWLMLSCWLIVGLATGCGQVESPAIMALSSQVIRFEVSDPVAPAGNEINLYWETQAADTVAIEVWGFVSYEQPQVQQIVRYTQLAAVGNQTMYMPGAPAGVYLIVDSAVRYDQPPNATIQLHPAFYQPNVGRFTVSKTEAHPGDGLMVEWETNSIHRLQLKTFLTYETSERSWSAPAQQFDALSASGKLLVTVPDSEADLVGISFELYYGNHDYSGYMRQVMVKVLP